MSYLGMNFRGIYHLFKTFYLSLSKLKAWKLLKTLKYERIPIPGNME